MEFALIIWLISSLNAINAFLVFGAVICTAIVLACVINAAESYDESKSKSWAKCGKSFATAAILIAFIATILPSTKTGWMMAGAYTAQTALQSDSAKKLGAIVEIKLQEVLDEAAEQAKIKAKSINESRKEKE